MQQMQIKSKKLKLISQPVFSSILFVVNIVNNKHKAFFILLNILQQKRIVNSLETNIYYKIKLIFKIKLKKFKYFI